MHVQSTIENGRAHVSIIGDMDMFSVEEFYKILKNSIEKYVHCDISVDLKGVEYVDSSGIAALIKFFRKHQSNSNKKFEIIRIKRDVFNLIKLVNIDKLIISDEAEIIS